MQHRYLQLSALALCLFSVIYLTSWADEDTTSAEAWSLIGSGAVLIDVRSVEEFEGGHLDGAINIPHTDLDALAEAIGDTDQPAVFYCRSGKRAGHAQSALEERGFTRIFNGLGYKDLSATVPASP
jgi:phage shock protein E